MRMVSSRRTIIALVGIASCVLLGLVLKQDTSGAIAMISIGIAGANAIQHFSNKKSE